MKLLILDPGHGRSTPGKRWTFPNGRTVFEWEIVREFCLLMSDTMPKDWDLHYTILPSDATDKPLSWRSNDINEVVAANDYEAFLAASVHTNAGGGEGTEVFTKPGKDRSDDYATAILYAVRDADFKIRTDNHSDGDPDKEKNLHMLREVKCPAVLIELFFHDSIKDIETIYDDKEKFRLLAKAVWAGITSVA